MMHNFLGRSGLAFYVSNNRILYMWPVETLNLISDYLNKIKSSLWFPFINHPFSSYLLKFTSGSKDFRGSKSQNFVAIM